MTPLLLLSLLSLQGYISRTPELGSDPHGPNPPQASLVFHHHHPYKPHSFDQQVTGFEQSFPRLGRTTQSDGGIAVGNAELLRAGSSQFLAIPPNEGGSGLPSPLNVPRPLSAPGSLQLNACEYQNGRVVATAAANKFSALSEIVANSTTHSSELYHQKNPGADGQSIVGRPQTLSLVNDMSHCIENGNSSDHPYHSTVKPKSNSDCLKCPQCGALFPRQPELFDRWFDHVTSQCPHSAK